MNQPEKELQKNMAIYLSHYFHVEREVKSVCGTARIDVMLVHKTDLQKKYPLGIELKVDENKKGHEIGEWVLQVMRYNNCKFIGYEKPIPFIYPQLSELYFSEGQKMAKHDVFSTASAHHGVNGMLGALGLGELQRFRDPRHTNLKGNHWHYRFSFSNQTIWDSRFDILDIAKINKVTHHKHTTLKIAI